MPIIDTLRPTTDVELIGYTLAGEDEPTSVWEALSDDSDSSFLDTPTALTPAPRASVGLGSTVLPSGYGRHRMRQRIRLRAFPGNLNRDVNSFLFWGVHNVNQIFWATPTLGNQTGVWYGTPQELIYHNSLPIVQSTRAMIYPNEEEPRQVLIVELWVDVDYRAIPTFSAVLSDPTGVELAPGSDIGQTSRPRFMYTITDNDGLPAYGWNVRIEGDALAFPVDFGGNGSPPPLVTGPSLPPGVYQATLSYATRIGGVAPLPGRAHWGESKTTTFEVTFEQPVPGDVAGSFTEVRLHYTALPRRRGEYVQ